MLSSTYSTNNSMCSLKFQQGCTIIINLINVFRVQFFLTMYFAQKKCFLLLNQNKRKLQPKSARLKIISWYCTVHLYSHKMATFHSLVIQSSPGSNIFNRECIYLIMIHAPYVLKSRNNLLLKFWFLYFGKKIKWQPLKIVLLLPRE